MKIFTLSLLVLLAVSIDNSVDAQVRFKYRYRGYGMGPVFAQPMFFVPPVTNANTITLDDLKKLLEQSRQSDSMTTNRQVDTTRSSLLRQESQAILSRLGLQERLLPEPRNNQNNNDTPNPTPKIPLTEFVEVP